MLDLRLAVAKALAACEETIGEWQRDVHERPVQSLDLEVRDADGNLVATVNGTLRLYPVPTGETRDYGTIMELPTRAQVISLLRHPPKPPTAAVLPAGSEKP
jgi:hypothetical protein